MAVRPTLSAMLATNVEISRLTFFSTLTNSGSITSSRRSLAPGSWPAGSRTEWISPSPLLKPVRIRAVIAGSAPVISRCTWSQDDPFLAYVAPQTMLR